MKKHNEMRNRSEEGLARRQVVDIPEKIMGRIFGRGREEGIDSTRMELIRRHQCSLKDESRSSSTE